MEPPPIISVAGDLIQKQILPSDQIGARQEEPVVIIAQASDQIRDITVVAATLHSLIRAVHDLLIIVVEAAISQVVAEVVVALAEVLPQA
jgi:hypothetical protein